MNKELIKEKKEALIVLGISIPLLCYGSFAFELGGIGNTMKAISVAVSLTFGLLGVIGGLVLLFTKNSLGLIGTKPETDSRRIRSPEELINLTIDDEFNKLRAKATSVDSKEPKPIIKEEKEMSKIKDAITKEKPTAEKAKKGSSVDLMKREKELLNRRDELNRMLEEAETKLTDVRENLESKGWVNSDDGWVIE